MNSARNPGAAKCPGCPCRIVSLATSNAAAIKAARNPAFVDSSAKGCVRARVLCAVKKPITSPARMADASIGMTICSGPRNQDFTFSPTATERGNADAPHTIATAARRPKLDWDTSISQNEWGFVWQIALASSNRKVAATNYLKCNEILGQRMLTKVVICGVVDALARVEQAHKEAVYLRIKMRHTRQMRPSVFNCIGSRERDRPYVWCDFPHGDDFPFARSFRLPSSLLVRSPRKSSRLFHTSNFDTYCPAWVGHAGA